MKTKITIFVFALFLFFLLSPRIYAQEKAADNSAVLSVGQLSDESVTERKADHRTQALQQYLEKYGTPLAAEAPTFVEQADAYNLDWKLVAAISGVESTFGQNVPSYCNNAWGFGIYQDHLTCFPSYTEAIKTVSKTLRQTYIDGWGDDDVYAIGRQYAASPVWAAKVEYFMNQINDYYTQFQNNHTTLPISL